MKELNLLTYETYFTFKVLVFYDFTLNFALAWYLIFGKTKLPINSQFDNDDYDEYNKE